ncbi:MAG: hypothetical protein U0L58_01580 [Ruminococcus sp.]|nr:hypothetical protein [Ruminococcus sp.]
MKRKKKAFVNDKVICVNRKSAHPNQFHNFAPTSAFVRTFLLGKSFFEILMEYLKIPCCVQAGDLRDNNIAKSKLSKKGAISVANLRVHCYLGKRKNSTSKSTSTPSLNGIMIAMMWREI